MCLNTSFSFFLDIPTRFRPTRVIFWWAFWDFLYSIWILYNFLGYKLKIKLIKIGDQALISISTILMFWTWVRPFVVFFQGKDDWDGTKVNSKWTSLKIWQCPIHYDTLKIFLWSKLGKMLPLKCLILIISLCFPVVEMHKSFFVEKSQLKIIGFHFHFCMDGHLKLHLQSL